MELTQLKYFLRLARILNFTEASKSLFITQSTLSISIKQLEEELETKLFDRIGKKVYLTSDGEILCQYAQSAIRTLDNGVEEINIGKKIFRGSLTIGLTYSTYEFLNSRIVDYVQKYPEVHLSINMYSSVDEVMDNLLLNRLDIAITYKTARLLPSVATIELSHQPLQAIVCQHHPLAGRRCISFEDLSDYPFVTFHRGTHTRSTTEHLFQKNGVKLEPQIEVNDTGVILDLIDTGHWISILSPLSIQHKKGYVAIPIAGEKEFLSVGVMWMKGRSKQKLAQTLLDEMQTGNNI